MDQGGQGRGEVRPLINDWGTRPCGDGSASPLGYSLGSVGGGNMSEIEGCRYATI